MKDRCGIKRPCMTCGGSRIDVLDISPGDELYNPDHGDAPASPGVWEKRAKDDPRY